MYDINLDLGVVLEADSSHLNPGIWNVLWALEDWFFTFDLCYYKTEFMVRSTWNTNQNTVQDQLLDPVQPPELSKSSFGLLTLTSI